MLLGGFGARIHRFLENPLQRFIPRPPQEKEKVMLQQFFARLQEFWRTPIVALRLQPKEDSSTSLAGCRDPKWNDSAALDEIWKERALDEPPRVLGTAGAAKALLDDVQVVFAKEMDVIYSPFTERHYCRHTDWLRDYLEKIPDDAVVGDPNDVSYLFGKQLRIGYVVEHDDLSGLTRETIESLDQRLTVFRLDGKIIAASPTCIIRMESRGGINIM